MSAYPKLQSVGPPPAPHADRVVAGMLRWTIEQRGKRLMAMQKILDRRKDATPEQQERLLTQLEDASEPFTIGGALIEQKKRGRYRMAIYMIDGWDPAHNCYIDPKHPMPPQPWLACGDLQIIGKGHHLYEQQSCVSILVTHHALSRAAQRLAAKSPGDLLAIAKHIFMAYVEATIEKRIPKVRGDYALRFGPLRADLSGIAMLTPHRDGDGGLVVATVYPADESPPAD